jgi:hypothetical protein
MNEVELVFVTQSGHQLAAYASDSLILMRIRMGGQADRLAVDMLLGYAPWCWLQGEPRVCTWFGCRALGQARMFVGLRG